MEYTTKSDIEQYLMIDIDASYNATIQSYIFAMSRYIDRTCNRVIYGTEESAFKYDGDNGPYIVINDCVDITDIKIDGVTRFDDIVAYPANKAYKSRIFLKEGYFPQGMQNVEVTAIQAMNKELPEDIKFACTVLVAGAFNAGRETTNTSSEKIGNYQINFTNKQQELDFDRAKAILSTYRRIAL